MDIWKEFHGPNAGYILDLYEKYKKDPSSVDPKTKALFELWEPELNGVDRYLREEKGIEDISSALLDKKEINKIISVVYLALAIRRHGHMESKIDPLGSEPPGDPTLKLETYGLTEEDLKKLPAYLVGWPIDQYASNAYEAIQKLREIYSSTSGYQYDHIYDANERKWLREVIETRRFRPPVEPINKIKILHSLIQVEMFEKFLHRMFPGKFRFSIEGVDMLVPMLNEVIGLSAKRGIHYILLGMAHRGRLNVMHHVLNKRYRETLIKFKDPLLEKDFMDDIGWTGDVKYHEPASRSVKNGNPVDTIIKLAPNPSHLESVNPVVQGMARAAGTDAERKGAPVFNPEVSFPIQVHGDAAFIGQGVNAETLNLSLLPGYFTGGTIHIITNNQLGYTTEPSDSRSTLYASDLAKGFEIPIIHVNADDPEACIEAARIAFNYKATFHKDFVIDLVGYRRHGHNESDEPTFTQPTLYKIIQNHPTVRELWASKLIEEGLITLEEVERIINDFMEVLKKEYESLKPADVPEIVQVKVPPIDAMEKVDTRVDIKSLIELNENLLKLPEGFHIHDKIRRTREKRYEALSDPDSKTVDWAMAEELAYASILADGIPIRFTGQDSERGTFSHRHAVLHDIEDGKTYVPLQSIPQAKASFEIHNSPLTENACIGFEYGYNVQSPNRLVIWEAQYGDFINGAQTMIDEYIVSARAKWGQTPSLVLYLPHAYEGQGPDHSSGRLERFLELAADDNLRIANCTTSAQFFHLLRTQALLLESAPIPLIVFTPKGLLRNPKVSSSPRELSEGRFLSVIDDSLDEKQKKKIKRLMLCSGKVYIDLISNDLREKTKNVAIVRVEQLYPLPEKKLASIIDSYPAIKEIVWLQEEPQNMGAWSFIYFPLKKIINGKTQLHYIGRKRNSSPAEGSLSMHRKNQEVLIKQAFTLNKNITHLSRGWIVWEKDV